MKLKLILTIITSTFFSEMRKKSNLAIYVSRRRRRKSAFPYKADTRVRAVATPATNGRETSVLIRSAIRRFPFKTRRKSPISTSIVNQK